MNLKDADKLIELIDDDIASLNKDMSREGYDVCLCTLQMVKQYIKALPTVPLDWKSIMDDWTKHDNAMIAKGRDIERRLNAPKHGRWLRTDAYPHKVYCSECYATLVPNENWLDDYNLKSNYCPNCGADMREVENG